MLKKLLVFVFLGMSLVGYSISLDSLNTIYTSSLEDVSLHSSFMQLIRFDTKAKYHSISILREEIVRAEKLDSVENIAYLYYRLGMMLSRKNRHMVGLQAYDTAYKMALLLKNKNLKAHVLLNMAVSRKSLGDMEKSTENYLEALKIYEELKDTLPCLIITRNLASSFSTLNNKEEAEKLLDKAVRISELFSQKETLKCYYSLAYYYSRFGMLDSQLVVVRKARILANELGVNSNYCNKLEGIALAESGKYEASNLLFEQYIEDSTIKVENRAIVLSLMSKNFYELQAYDKSLTYINLAKESRPSIIQKIRILMLNQRIYRKLNQDKQALKIYDELYVLKNEFTEKSSNAKITKLKEQQEVSRRDLIISSLETEKAILSNKNKVFKFGISLFLLLFITVSFGGYTYYRKNQLEKKTNILLLEQKMEIAQSLQDKEMLLKEIHHRVKNNLQLISSIFNLQSKLSKGKSTEEVMELAKARINTIALIHEKFYQSSNLATVSIKAYMEDLFQFLVQAYNQKLLDVDLSLEMDDMDMGMDELIPCGLVVNEIISNIFKHAFDDSSENFKIGIRGKVIGRYYEICIEDSGKGMPDDFDIGEYKSLGMRLIQQIVEYQLDGSVDVKNDNGTKFTFNFRIV